MVIVKMKMTTTMDKMMKTMQTMITMTTTATMVRVTTTMMMTIKLTITTINVTTTIMKLVMMICDDDDGDDYDDDHDYDDVMMIMFMTMIQHRWTYHITRTRGSWSSYLYDGNSYTGTTSYLYWRCPLFRCLLWEKYSVSNFKVISWHLRWWSNKPRPIRHGLP